jgi:SAM-dependent methyltransferase
MKITTCRNCGSQLLKEVLNLGRMPLANSLLKSKDEVEEKFPLEVVFCENCYLLQLTEIVPPEKMFSEYVYLSSCCETTLANAKELTQKLIKIKNLNKDSFVVEIGSNDGYLLQYLVEKGISVLGIEPAKNVAEIAIKKGIRTLPEFFSLELAKSLSKTQKADVVIANNVLAHIPDIDGTIKGIAQLLKEDGLFVGEVPYAKDLIDKNEFDTIYHEHLSYFSVSSLKNIFESRGLKIIDIEYLPNIHGGSLRIFASPKGETGQNVLKMIEEEKKAGMQKIDYYRDFKTRVEKIKETLRNLVSEIKDKGKTLAGYGASAKGTILLNYCDIKPEFVADINPIKQGKFIPGVKVPVESPKKLIERKPDYTLLLVWNIKEEVLKQQEEYRKIGGKFIIPIPSPQVV